jgi:hypothetical protein
VCEIAIGLDRVATLANQDYAARATLQEQNK